MGFAVLAQARPALAQQVFDYDIPRGDLATVVTQIARTSGRPIAFPAGLAAGRVAGPIRGRESPDGALSRALAGTGLRAVPGPGGSLSIRAADASATATVPGGADLAAIDVVDSGGGRFGDDGFQAGNAGETVRLAGAPLREIPIAVTAVTNKVIRSQGVTDPSDATRNVAGVTIDSSPQWGGQPAFTIRGIGDAVGTLTVNGQSRGGYGGVPIDNVERVEVLKGPTSILSGAVATGGGLVNFALKEPTAERIRDLTVRYGSYAYKTIATDLGGVVEGLEGTTFRFVGSANHAAQNEGGYRDPHELLFAPSLRWQGDGLSVSGGVSYSNQRFGRPSATLIPYLGAGVPGEILRVPRGVPRGNPGYGTLSQDLTAWTKQSYEVGRVLDMDVTLNNSLQYAKSRGSALAAIYEDTLTIPGFIQPLGLQSYSVYSRNITDRFDITANYRSDIFNNTMKLGYDYVKKYDRASLNFALAFPGNLDLLTGLTEDGARLPRVKPFLDISERDWTEAHGIYVIDKIDMLDNRLHILGSVRRDSYEASSLVAAPQDVVSSAGLNKGSGAGISWVAGGAFDVAPWLTVYGNRSDGVAADPTFNTVTGAIYKPEERDLAEIGARTYLFDKRLTLTTSLYDLVRNNVTIADPIDQRRTFTVNGLRTRGVEVEAQGEIVTGLNLIAAFTALTPQLLDERARTTTAAALNGIPKQMASLWATYSFQDPALSGLTVGAGFQYVGSSRVGSFDSTNLYRLPGYVTADAMIGFEKGDVRVDFKLNNILNEYAYLPSRYAYYIPLLRGRNALLQMTYKF
ncbi:TonB-dependent siderophore receptor [Methylobacterium sp. JK268]